MDKFAKDIQTWYKKRIDMVKLVCKPKQQLIKDNEINMFGGFMHEKKSFEAYPDTVKEAVQFMLNFIKEVICSDQEDQFDYMMKWLANMANGNKNDSVLYLKGEEGIGKSTLTDFIVEWVLGKLCYGKGTSTCLLTPNNMSIRGKLVVVFEELPTFSDKEWEGVSSVLKDMTTGTMYMYADKYIPASLCENISNFIIITNVNAIKHSEGRRYFILDLNTKRKSDFKYFAKLKNMCYNKEVGGAFYNYLLNIDLTGFYAQEFPHTKAKALAKVISISLPYQFLKEEYVLKRRGFEKIKRKSLYEQYSSYLLENHRRIGTSEKANFYSKLESINIKARKSNGEEIYDAFSAETLFKIAEKNNWIHESDDFEKPVNSKDEISLNIEMIDELKERNKFLEEDLVTAVKEKQVFAEIEERPKKVKQDKITTEMLEKVTPYKAREIPNVFVGGGLKSNKHYKIVTKNLFSTYENMEDLSNSLI
jgi:hypothetical protein